MVIAYHSSASIPGKTVRLTYPDIYILFYNTLKLIICYISSGATNIAEVSSGFHQADWSNTLVIVIVI